MYSFLLVIVLSVLLRFKDSDYPFDIFKLFLFTKINHNKFTSFSTIFKTHNLKHILMNNILCISVRENRRGHPEWLIERHGEHWSQYLNKEKKEKKNPHTQQRKLNRWATRNHQNIGEEPRYPRRVSIPCFLQDTRQITHKVTTWWTPLLASKHKPHNKSWHLLQRNGSWDEPNVVFMRKS